jgi:hypothetical protein
MRNLKRQAPKKSAAKKPPQKAPARRVVKKSAAKRSRTMSTTAVEPRGAGSGEHAVATRSRNPKDTAFAKGDIAKGRIDPEEVTTGQVAELKAARDRRAYLVDQAEKNEAANDELNAIQVEQNRKLQLVQNIIQDPDEMRDSSMETAINALKEMDPDTRRAAAADAIKARAKDRKDDTKK